MKQIKGYEDLYQIDEFGNVYSNGKGKSTCPNWNVKRIIKPSLKKNGYLSIKLFKDGKRKYYLVHRLVAENYLTNELNFPQVNHKDANKINNHFTNLEWCTAKENILHSKFLGLQKSKKGIENSCSKQILQFDLNNNFIKEWGSINEVKRELNYNSFGIIKCCKKIKKYKTAYGFKWEYKNA